jgi:hypothetical protein
VERRPLDALEGASREDGRRNSYILVPASSHSFSGFSNQLEHDAYWSYPSRDSSLEMLDRTVDVFISPSLIKLCSIRVMLGL